MAGGHDRLGATVTLKNEGTFNLTTSATKTLSGTGSFENASGATMNWYGGNLTLNSNLTNNGTFVYRDEAGNANIYGAADFINNGTFVHEAIEPDNVIGGGSGRFVNNGTFEFTNIGDFEMNEDYTFVNSATGTVLKSAGRVGSNPSLFFTHCTGITATGRTFDNQGTVEVRAGALEFLKNTAASAPFVLVQYDEAAKTLTGGTWIVNDADDSGIGPPRSICSPQASVARAS